MSEALRHDVVETIGRWQARDPEAIYRSVSWRALAADEQLLTRQAVPAHFTASALPMTPDGARVCLVLHRRMGVWVQPGGHFEPPDRSVTAAAGREMQEETGLVGEVHPLPLLLSRHAAPCQPGAWHLDIQMLAVCDLASPTVSAESQEVAWFEGDCLPGDIAPGVADLVQAGRGRLSRSGSPAPPPTEL